MASFRLFVALPLPANVRERLAAQQQALRQEFAKGLSYPAADNLHLTLRFLGEVESFRVEPLGAALDEACAGFNSTTGSLSLTCERLGCFPDLRYPRIVWSWVSEASDDLVRLHSRIAQACQPFAPSEDKNFMPHITLARVRHLDRDARQRLADSIEAGVSLTFGQWNATEILLMRSELGSGSARYTTLKRFTVGS